MAAVRPAISRIPALQLLRNRYNVIGMFSILLVITKLMIKRFLSSGRLALVMDKPRKMLKVQVQSKEVPASFSHDNTTVQSNRSRSSSKQNADSVVVNANTTVHSNRSGSSSNQNVDSVAVNANTDNTEFVHHGLILWTEMRQQWVGNRPRNQARQLSEPVLRSNASYERLLESQRQFSRRIPLPEMIKFLETVWEEEGLYENA